MGALRSVEVVKPEARSAIVWILGSFGEKLQEAPYILEGVGYTFDEEDERVQLAMMTAVMKLFFKRPPECHQLLLDILDKGSQCANQDVHDRALFYSRLLKRSIDTAKNVVGGDPPTTATFSEQLGSELTDTLFKEFNSLSALYYEPASSFVADDSEIIYEQDLYLVDEEGETANSESKDNFGAAYADTNLLDLSDDVAPVNDTQQQPQQQQPQNPMSLLDDLASLSVETAPVQASNPPAVEIQLNPSPFMDAGKFQQLWGSLGNQEVFSVTAGNLSVKVPELGNAMRSQGIQTMASGGQEPVFKFYQYAQLQDASAVFLVELIVSTQAGTLACTCKSDSLEASKMFASYFEQKLRGYATM